MLTLYLKKKNNSLYSTLSQHTMANHESKSQKSQIGYPNEPINLFHLKKKKIKKLKPEHPTAGQRKQYHTTLPSSTKKKKI